MGTTSTSWKGLRTIKSDLLDLNTQITTLRPLISPAFTGTAWMENDQTTMNNYIIDLWNDYDDRTAPNFAGGNSIMSDLITGIYGPIEYVGSTLYGID